MDGFEDFFGKDETAPGEKFPTAKTVSGSAFFVY